MSTWFDLIKERGDSILESRDKGTPRDTARIEEIDRELKRLHKRDMKIIRSENLAADKALETYDGTFESIEEICTTKRILEIVHERSEFSSDECPPFKN